MGFNPTVLVIKGKHSQFDQIQKDIEKADLICHVVQDVDKGIRFFSEHRPSFIFMDLVVSGKDAIEVLADLDKAGVLGNCTTVVFSDRNEHYVEVSALDAGADDYLVKPVNKRVFSSRLHSWKRRQIRMSLAMNGGSGSVDFTLDEERYMLIVNGADISLQRKEFEIISLLVSRPRKVFSRKEIRQVVWGNADKGKNRTIDVHIRNLRSKIGPKFIKTYKGVGYSFEK
jgi:two-component system alkaline phosphatase synthesis response regulator PhoP